jgi:DNA helicase-2/ATP-dependent DNA helicase PcrA
VIDLARPALNIEQQAAVEFATGPLRIMAGAGTGKTETIAQSIVSLVNRGLANPSQILAVTFTIKAAEELRGRVDSAVRHLAGVDESVDVDTYHAFGGRIVAEHGYRVGLPPDPTVLTSAESWMTLWRSLDRIDFRHLELSNLRDNQNSPLTRIIGYGSRLSDELRDLNEVAPLADSPDTDDQDLADYVGALREYGRAKQARGAIDFGDQIVLACQLLDLPDVLARYADRYRYMLVDEFQDTNFAQRVMVRKLGAALSGNVRGVGDPNQAIYAFRGAAPDNLDRFADEDFPCARTVALSRNYRSTGAILAVANAVWAGDEDPYRGNLQTDTQPFGNRPRLVACEAFADEIAYIAAEITRLVESGRQYRDVALIVRKNAVKRSLWRGLRAHGIPAEAIGGSSLYETPEVRLIISALRVIGDPQDDAALAHLLSADRWGIDERALYRLAIERVAGESLLASARRIASERDDPDLIDLNDCLKVIDGLVTRSYRVSLPRLVDDVLERIGGAFGVTEEANCRRFRGVVQVFADSRLETPNLRELLAYLDLLLATRAEEEAVSDADLGESDTVKILTAHAAKGLEFPVVFIAGANKNDFKFRNQRADLLTPELLRPVPGMPIREDYEVGPAGTRAFRTAIATWQKEQQSLEERRVLYVALTRAREELYLTWSRTTPTRKTPSALYELLKPVAEHCEQVSAPATRELPRRHSVGDVAREIVPGLTTLLERAGSDAAADHALLGTVSPLWADVRGAPEDPRMALATFIEQRETTRGYALALRAMERAATDSLRPHREAGDGAISYSQLELFRACPHRYYLRHVIGLPGLPQTGSAQFGTDFHGAIALEARARRRGATISDESFRTWIAAAAPATASPVSESAGNSVDPATAYLASIDRMSEPLLVEEAFVLRLDDVVLNGVIDRVHRRPDGDLEVVDYKTDRQARTEDEIRAGLQLQIYLLACQDAFPEITPSPTRAAMFFVRTGDRVEMRFSDDDLTAARAEIVARARDLRTVTAEDHRAAPSTCKWCEFRLTCRHSLSRD